MSEASRNKYGIRTDAAGEFYSTLLQAEPRITDAQHLLQADEPGFPSQEVEMSDMAPEEPEEEVRDEEHEVFIASRPTNEWQEFALAEWEHRPTITARESSLIRFGDATVAEVSAYHAKLNRWRHFILVARDNAGV